jgi:hypothetical protein
MGVAKTGSLVLPGVTVTCEFNPKLTIWNSSGVGKAEVTEFPMEKCGSSEPACTVESATAGRLGWPAHLATVAGEDYLVIEGIEIKLALAGEDCAYAGMPLTVKGTAGGVISNVNHTITFNGATFKATGTNLKLGASAVEWNATLGMVALGEHKGQGLEG